MRIRSIGLTWFRGAAESDPLETDCKSLVVYGQNGTGKSSFVDAVEYAINNGKIEHLANEYSGRNQERAILNTHKPATRSTEFRIAFENDDELKVKIAPNGSCTRTGAEAIAMESWDYRRTVLRQHEVAEFINSRKGDKYSALLPLFGLQELEIAAENLRQLAKTIITQAKLVERQGTSKHYSIMRKQNFGDDSDGVIENKIVRLHEKYCERSKTTEILARCNELKQSLTKSINEHSEEHQRYVTLQEISMADIAGHVNNVRSANASLAMSMEPLITEKLEVLRVTDVFATRLQDEQEVSCPACGRSILVNQFKTHVKDEQERLKDITSIFETRKNAVNLLIDSIKIIKRALGKDEVKVWRDELEAGIKANVERLEDNSEDDLRQSLGEEDLNAIEINCIPVMNAASTGSEDAPSAIRTLATDKTDVEAALETFEAKVLENEISTTKELIAFINEVENGVRNEIRTRAVAVVKNISSDIGLMWKILHPGEPIDDIQVYLPENDKAIDISLRFHGKNQGSPRLTLSEGYRNSLGLCIFLALAKHDTRQDRPLFLDDVVISLDRNHRGMVAQLLEDQFAERQVIIFTHDRDWFAELRLQLAQKRWGFKTLLPYQTPDIGIRWSHKTTTFDDARGLLADRPDSAGNDARKIMDTELSLIAEKLELRLTYKRSTGNDNRTAYEFLERFLADGKNCFQNKVDGKFVCYIDGLDLLDKSKQLLATWGNKASHSYDVSNVEAMTLIETCERALNAFRCAGCKTSLWSKRSSNGEWIECQCGILRWRL